MNRKIALELVQRWTKNKNLVKHMLAVEAEMRALAKHFKEDENRWGVLGLVHDADYEKMDKNHPSEMFIEKLKGLGFSTDIIQGVKTHAWGFRKDAPEPKTKMEWSLYCGDELSGLIIACALVKPDKKLSSVTVESVMKKWPKKDFAKGVDRRQIELCEAKLGIKLEDFIKLNLQALQSINKQLEL